MNGDARPRYRRQRRGRAACEGTGPGRGRRGGSTRSSESSLSGRTATRALVAVALGQIADRRDIRVLARLSKDINYRASVPALDEILTIL